MFGLRIPVGLQCDFRQAITHRGMMAAQREQHRNEQTADRENRFAHVVPRYNGD
jgi:hypothetical protein